MPRIFRDRIGTTKLSLFVMSVAVLALFCFAAVPSASAQTSISFYLNVIDSGKDAIPTNSVLVTVTLNPDGVAIDNNEVATVNLTGEIATDGHQYYMEYAIINVNGILTGGAPTVTVTKVTGTNSSGGTDTYTTSTADALDGYGFAAGGGHSLEANDTKSSDASKSITFTLTSTTAWASASTVLLSTNVGNLSVDAAAKIGTSTTGTSDTLDIGGLYTPSPTPEPMSYLLFGSGLLLLGVVSRKKLGLGRS